LRKVKLIKDKCEICGEVYSLHLHHIIERTDPRCTNDNANLAIVCATCHGKIHNKIIKIIGMFPSTKLPNGRTLVYEINNISNVPGIKEAYFEDKVKDQKIFGE
jgi:hypothetical protein